MNRPNTILYIPDEVIGLCVETAIGDYQSDSGVG